MIMRRLTPALLCIGVIACNIQPEVEVNGEVLRGEYLADVGVAVFRSIPFAEPPLGYLRWRPPQPLGTKLARRETTAFAPVCMQSPRILEWYRDMAEIFGSSRDVFEDLVTSEDCLYLNIWSPDLHENAALPVMVYIHGGSNNSGWSYEPNYHGHALAKRGVVLVSIAYRLGVFGFLSHPDLDDDNGIANFGLWDQVKALKWIQEYIRQFGGDPKRVTVFGESSGAQDILALMASDKAAGLFHGAILQSNAGFGISNRNSPTLDDERQRGVQTAEIFGFKGADALQKLRSVPAQELLKEYEQRFPDYYHSPTVDGQLLKKPVWQIINDGELSGIPFIIGSNADEWYDSTPKDVDEDDVVHAVEASDHLNTPEALAAVQSETDHRKAIDRILTADGILCPSQYLAATQSASNDNAWVYYFARLRDGGAGAQVRTYHGAELPYVFGTHDPWITTTVVDWQLSDQMIAYWTQFATIRDPNADGLPDWPIFAAPNYQVMEFTNVPSPTAAPERILCRVFRESVDRD